MDSKAKMNSPGREANYETGLDPQDYASIKPHLFVEVINTRQNAGMLDDFAHTEIEDLSMVYKIWLGRPGASVSGSILISNEMLDKMGVSLEQLHADALENACHIKPALIRPLEQLIGSSLSSDQDPSALVVTTKGFLNGACAIFYPGIQEECSRSFSAQYYILPSSVHEVILIPDNGLITTADLQEMVSTINSTVVEPSERLSNNVYHFDSKCFERGERFEAKREASRGEKGGSVLDELKKLQKECSRTTNAADKPSRSEEVL